MIERNEKVVITGSGIVCGAGATVDNIWSVLESGQTAISEHEAWDTKNWPMKMGCAVTESNRDLVPQRKLHKSISRIDMLGIYAGEQAIENSGLLGHRDQLPEDAQPAYSDRSGLIVAAGGANFCRNYDYFPLMSEVDRDLPKFGQELNGMVSPMWLLQSLPNNVLCHIGIRAQLKGYNACITNQITGGMQSITEGAEAIWYGDADRIVAIGHDSVFEPESAYYYHRMGLHAENYVRPFDKDRDGLVIGEGAGSLVLEKANDAQARGAKVLGEILGYACVSEATGVTAIADDGNGVERAIRGALENANLEPKDIGMICAHGNGTRQSDLTEGLAIGRVFGSQAPPVTSMKWAYGHLFTAAGIADVVMTLAALSKGVVPGIGTLQTIDPEIGENLPVSAQHQTPTSDTALVISRGFGGMNFALIIKK